VFDFSRLDATVEVMSLHAFDVSLTTGKTPDWLIYLRAKEAGFDAVVTRDRSQLDDPEEVVALVQSGMNVITWRHRIEDPIQEWGHLLAYMGLIRKRLEGEPRSQIIQLPRPSLGGEQVAKSRRRLNELASARRMSFPELRSEAVAVMKDELEARGHGSLVALLVPHPR
jgi:hypothetical protein